VALSRPRTTRRLLRGSALGLGLLVAGGITAPAAFAIEDPTGPADQPAERASTPAPLEETPAEAGAVLAAPLSGDFGLGKSIEFQVAGHGPVPGDLDLSGAVFQAAPLDGGPGYTCTTDASGTCSFDTPWFVGGGWLPFNPFESTVLVPPATGPIPFAPTAEGSDASIPAGMYTVTQLSASPGLAPAAGLAIVELCSFPYGCEGEAGELFESVGNDSLFRTQLVTTVTDSVTGAPVGCASYELTGPDYPHDEINAPEPSGAGPVPADCTASPVPTAPTTTATPTTTTPTPTAPTTTAPTTTAPNTTTDAPSSSTSSTSADTSTDGGTSASSSSSSAAPETVVPGPLDIVRHGFVREDGPVSFGTGVTDAAGTITFHGFFLPAEGYLLTPTHLPAGYTPDAADAFGISTTPRQAAAGTQAQVARTVTGPLAGGAPAPGVPGGAVASAAPTTTTAAAAAPTSAGTPAAADPALATTGTPVETMALVGGGLVALGAGALATGGVLRRRARQHV